MSEGDLRGNWEMQGNTSVENLLIGKDEGLKSRKSGRWLGV